MSRDNGMRTYTGKDFYFDRMDPGSICIEDIAHALSNICRFSGHVPSHYSVAQHSLLVASLCPEPLALIGLLHDATEAYIGDMVTPLKRMIPAYKDYEDKLWCVIAEKFEVCLELPIAVHNADLAALSIEARYLIGVDPMTWGLKPARPIYDAVQKMTPKQAEKAFLKEFEAYAKTERVHIARGAKACPWCSRG